VDTLIEATRQVEQDHFWFQGFRRFLQPFLLKASQNRPLRILDCGCGTGLNLTVLEQFGETYGLDITFSGLLHAKNSNQKRLTQATAASLPFLDRTFDLVTSFDVLYCLDDEAEGLALNEMFRLLRPNGSVIIHVPAMHFLRGNHSVFVHEVRRYSRSQLTRSLEHAGFQISRMTYTNATLFLPILVVRLFQQLRGLRSAENATSDFSHPYKPVNVLLTKILALEAFMVNWTNLPFGTSLLCLATKPHS
jgi:ubiquinone/menaquinone biosynthesis C-methylase UbiE